MIVCVLTCMGQARTSGILTVTRTCTNTCNSGVFKNLVKTVKYLEFLANVYSSIAVNVVCRC